LIRPEYSGSHKPRSEILYFGRGFDLDEPPSTVPASMQNIDAHEHAAVLEGAFENCGDFAVRS